MKTNQTRLSIWNNKRRYRQKYSVSIKQNELIFKTNKNENK